MVAQRRSETETVRTCGHGVPLCPPGRDLAAALDS